MSNVFSCQQKQFSNPSLATTSCEPIARHLHVTEEWEGNFLLSPFCTARMEQSPRHLAHMCALPALPGNLRIQEAGTKAGMVRKWSEAQLSGRSERRARRKPAQLVGWRKTHAPFSSPFLLSHLGGNPGQREQPPPHLKALKLILAVLFCWCLTSYIWHSMFWNVRESLPSTERTLRGYLKGLQSRGSVINNSPGPSWVAMCKVT